MEASACKGAGLGRVLLTHRVTTQCMAHSGHQETVALPGPYIWDNRLPHNYLSCLCFLRRPHETETWLIPAAMTERKSEVHFFMNRRGRNQTLFFLGSCH